MLLNYFRPLVHSVVDGCGQPTERFEGQQYEGGQILPLQLEVTYLGSIALP